MRIAFIDRNLNPEWRLVTSISRKINKRPFGRAVLSTSVGSFLKSENLVSWYTTHESNHYSSLEPPCKVKTCHRCDLTLYAGYSLDLALCDKDQAKIDLNAKKTSYPWPLQEDFTAACFCTSQILLTNWRPSSSYYKLQNTIEPGKYAITK